jgi:hypothetical protein
MASRDHILFALLKQRLLLAITISALGMLYALDLVGTADLAKTLLVVLGIEPVLRVLFLRGDAFLAPGTLIPITYLLYTLGPLAEEHQFSDETTTKYLLLQIWLAQRRRIPIS